MNAKRAALTWPLLGAGALALVCLLRPEASLACVTHSTELLGEIALIVPPVILLMGLLDAWTPPEWTEKRLGSGSGARGCALSILLGALAVGPLYAAFPLAMAMREKGARPANVAMFLNAWGPIKIPMFLIETSFIGLRFALLRLAFTLPLVVAGGLLLEKLLGRAAPKKDHGPERIPVQTPHPREGKPHDRT